VFSGTGERDATPFFYLSIRIAVIGEQGFAVGAVRDGNWKLVLPQRGWYPEALEPLAKVGMYGHGRMLFDLAADRGERHDVAGAHPDVVDRLEREIAAFTAAASPAPVVRVDAAPHDHTGWERMWRGVAEAALVAAFVTVAIVLAIAWLGWRAFFYQEEGDPVGSAMLAFEKQNSLNVFSSRFEIVAESENAQGVLGIDILKSRQATIIPATVTYRLDVGSMDRDAFAWDPANETLNVVLPPLRISRPNLDEAQARVFTEGNWVTANAQADLSRNNSLQAERKAAVFAKNPEVLALARNAAKDAIRQNLAIPLQVAGYENAKVTVRFEGEKPAG
jgi:hypothetical protein